MPQSTNYTIKKLLELQKYGNGIGLHRVKFLTERLRWSDWWQGLDPINVVGTDGKGSTATMVSAILSALNITNGKFTSPHLFAFNERIMVNQKPIADIDLETISSHVFKLQEAYLKKYPKDTFGAFEVFTSIALEYFYLEKVETLVLEAGIGGRYDSTRICTGNFAALTSVSLEHTEILGKTLEEIAYDKMDILNAGGTLVVGEMDKVLLEKIRVYALVKGIKVLPVNEHCIIHKVEYEMDKMVLNLGIEELVFKKLECNLVGEHQVSNIQVAILIAKKWLALHYPKIETERFIEAVEKALAQLVWKGRMQRIHDQPAICIDAAHTPNALQNISKTVQKMRKSPMLVIFGCSEKRPIQEMITALAPIVHTMICTQASHRGEDVEEVYQYAKDLKLNTIQANDLPTAIQLAKEIALKENIEILITGGLFLAIESYVIVSGKSVKDLNFF